ncbi:MAG: hypothetical protein LBT92_00625 [Rickettsiales bacterium]|jgi:hypothetical protein|nr:hypothetical protein [Rickettsiales bacterium]
MKDKSASGASMVEMLLIIGITIVVGAAIIRQSGEASEKVRRLKAQNQITDLRRKVNLIYSGRSWPNNMLEDDFTKDLGLRGLDLLSPWKADIREYGERDGARRYGNITVTPNDGFKTNKHLANPGFGLKVPKLARQSCIWLANQFMEDSACIILNDKPAVSDSNCAKNTATIIEGCNADENSVQIWFMKE